MIHVIGDSHVSVFSGANYMQPTYPHKRVDHRGDPIPLNDPPVPGESYRLNNIPGISQYRLGPLTAYNFEENADIHVQGILSTEVDRENDWVFFNLGEIDCSNHLPERSEQTSVDRAVEACVRKYVTYVARVKSQGYRVGVVGPHIAAWHLHKPLYLEITSKFNGMLKMTGFPYISVYDYVVANPDPANYIDGYHLSDRVIFEYQSQLQKLGIYAG